MMAQIDIYRMFFADPGISLLTLRRVFHYVSYARVRRT